MNDAVADNEVKGYCPLPGSEVIKNDIKWKIQMWLTSYNCHTYDRDDFRAQFDCGARRLYSVIDQVTQSNF